MGLSVKQGSFTITSSDSGTITISGLGSFTPKLVKFFSDGRAANGTVADFNLLRGAMSGAGEQGCYAWWSEDAQGSSDTRTIFASDACLIGFRGAGVTDFKYSFNSFSNGQFVLNVDNTPDQDRRIGFIAYGGDAIEAVVGNIQTGTGTGGIGPSGLSIDPTFVEVIGFCPNDGYTSYFDDNMGCIGIATGPSDEYSTSWRDEDAQGTSDCFRITRDTVMLHEFNGSGGVEGGANFSSMDVGGFTIYVGNNFSQNYYIMYIAVEITDVAVGYFEHPTSTPPVDITVTGLSFKPNALECFGQRNTAFSSSTADSQPDIGATDGVSEYNAGSISEDAQGTSDTKRWNYDDELLTWLTVGGSIDVQIEFSSWESDGFKLSTTNVPASSSEKTLYAAFGVEDEDGPNLVGNLAGNLLGGFQS